MKNLVIFLFAISVITIQSCKKDNSGASCNDGSGNYPHLAVGHTMSYYMTGFSISDDTLTFHITSKNGSTYSITTTSQNGGAQSYAVNQFWRACDKEYYSSTDANNLGSGYWFSLDKNVGDSWTRTVGNITSEYRLYSKNASITTAYLGQTFTNCYKFSVHQANTINTDTIYFKPDVGIMAYEGWFLNYELVSKNF